MATTNVTIEPARDTADVFVGPRPFRTGEKLYARERECADLVSLLISERVVLLFSPSGAGKTSLVQASLVPAMRHEEFDVPVDNPTGDGPPQPLDPAVIIRVNREPDPADPPGSNRYLLSILAALENHRPREQRRPLGQLASLRLSQYLNEAFPECADGVVTEPGATFHPLLLLFDQFEELLRLDPTDTAAKWEFIHQLSEALRNRRRWILLAMREEYVATLLPFGRALPTQLTASYRLELLRTDDGARLAIEEPVHAAGVQFEDGLVDKLINELRQVRVQQSDGTFAAKAGDFVEPVHLQVICRRLWQKRHDPRCISHADLKALAGTQGSGVDAILGDYYAEQVHTAASSDVGEQRIRTWFAERLIAAQKVRLPVLQTQALEFGLTSKCLKVLEDSYLIRREQRSGAQWYELAHDRLIDPIIADNDGWFAKHMQTWQRQARLWDAQGRPPDLLVRGEVLEEGNRFLASHSLDLKPVERAFLRACQDELNQEAAEKERKRQEQRHRRLRNAFWIILGFVLLLLAATVVAVVLWRIADAQKEEATSQKAEADKQKKVADEQKDEATRQKAEADKQKKMAEELGALAQDRWWMAEGRQRLEYDLPLTLALGWEALNHVKKNKLLPFPPLEQLLRDALVEDPRTIARGGGSIQCVAVRSYPGKPEENYLALGSANNSILLWKDAVRGNLTSQSTPLHGHHYPVTRLAFHAKKKILFSCDTDDQVLRWNLASDAGGAGEEGGQAGLLAEPFGGKQAVLPQSANYGPVLALSRDARWLVTTDNRDIVGNKNRYALWDLNYFPERSDDANRAVPLPRGIVKSAVFSADSRFLVLVLYNAKLDGNAVPWSYAVVDLNQFPKEVTARTPLTAAPRLTAVADKGKDGRWLLLVSQFDNTPRLSRLGQPSDPERELPGHAAPVTALAFSPDHQWIATGTADGLVRCWKWTENPGIAEPLLFVGHQSGVTHLAFAPDNQMLFSSSLDGTARRWNLKLPHPSLEPCPLTGHTTWIYSIAVARDSSWLATSDGTGQVLVWKLSDALPVRLATLTGNNMDLAALAKLALQQPGVPLRYIRLGKEGIPWQWDLPANSPALNRWAPRFVISPAKFHFVSPDQHWLAVAQAQDQRTQLGLWDLDQPGLRGLVIQSSHPGKVVAVAFSPDSRILVAAWDKGTVELWRLRSARPTRLELSLSPWKDVPTAVAISSDARWLVGCFPSAQDDPNAKAYVLRHDLTQDAKTDPVRLTTNNSAVLTAAAVSDDGQRLLAGGSDKDVRLWDLTSITSSNLATYPWKYEPVTLAGHRDKISQVVISPDQKLFVTADLSGQVRVWRLSLDSIMDLAKKSKRGLTPEEKTFFGVK
jgi:WD40 repeat protein